jgi:hypothetical protein
VLLFAAPASAQNGSRIYFNQDIFIAQGQQVRNAVCLFCSVQVEGEVTGNAVVLFGNLNASGRVDGPAVIVGGNAVIDSQARLGGNLIVLRGNAVYEADESISGNAWVLGGHMSPVGGRAERSTKRFSFSPFLSMSLVIVAFLLLSGIVFARRRVQTA